MERSAPPTCVGGATTGSGLVFLVLVLSGAVLVLEWGVMTEPICDHEKLDVYRLSIEYVAASYGIAKGLTGANRHIRDQ